MKRLLIFFFALFVSFGASLSVAQAEPLGFRRVRATFALGLDCFDVIEGDFGNAADIGMAVYAETTLQLMGYLGLNLRIGSARAFTNKDFLPFDNGVQFIYLTFAPRAYVAPFRKMNLYLYIQPEISLNVFMSNTLVKITGNNGMSGGVGGAIGAQYIIGIVSISAQVFSDYHWKLESVMIGGGITVGISSPL